MQQQLTKAMIRELRSIEGSGNPSDPIDWHTAGALWFHAREKVLGALLRRGLIVDDGDFRLTESGKEALHK
jgi:hypothetical protein